MTREEAIVILENEAEYLYGNDMPYNREAFKMAVDALMSEPTVQCKDCKYWRYDDCQNDNHGYCPINENDYCSQGVRKEVEK